MPDLDWSEMEGLFCQQAPMAPTSQSGVLNFRLGQDTSECDKKRKEPTEVHNNIIFSYNSNSLPLTLENKYFIFFYSISDCFTRRKTKFKR